MISAKPPALGGHYIVEGEIGRGGMAVVYRAHDRRHNRSVAVKVLDRGLAASLGTSRFLQEIGTIARLSHPNIVPVHDSGEHDGLVYYVMPYIEGETLRQRIDREKRMPVAEVVRITGRVAAALDFAHRHGVVHRDIKPGNIILFEGEPLVLDFGIAKALTDAAGPGLTQSGVAVGTPAYLSPEQATADTGVDGRSDQYSLACTVYEMVSGFAPFTGTSPQGVIAKRFTEQPRSLADPAGGVSREFAQVVARALSLESADRFPTVTEFAEALARATVSPDQYVSERGRPSIAILPFANLSTDAENDFFAAGITEEIINALTRVRALTVSSRTASFAFKGRTEDVGEIARKLRVRHILEGSVRKGGNRLRVTVQLVDAASGNALWSDRYDRELADVFAIQDEIASRIVDALEVVLTGDEQAAMGKVPTRSVRAYEYYLRGRELFHRRNPEALTEAEEMYRRAIALDPHYAQAYAGLADCSTVRHSTFGGGEEALAQADAASARALELDPSLAEAHAARGMVLNHRSRFREAESEFREAIRLDPTSYEAMYFYARMLWAEARLEEAAATFEAAARLRPDDYQSLAFAANMYHALGREARAREIDRSALEAARHYLAINPGDSRASGIGAILLLQLGQTEEAEEWSSRAIMLDATNPLNQYNAACFQALAGKSELAIEHLERAIDLGFRNTNWLINDSDLAAVREHPRFDEILERSRSG